MSYAQILSRRLPFVVRYSADLLTYRHLCLNLVASDLRSRFRRSYLGILWAVIQPLSLSLMIAVVWGTLMGAENYWDFALYVFSGFILWDYFATVVNVSQDSLTQAEGYLKQTRIPFLAFQIRVPMTGIVIMFFGAIGLLILQITLNRVPTIGFHTLLIPLFFAVYFLFSVPLAILLSIVGTTFRDAKYVSLIAVQGLFFVSPVMLGREVLDRPELQFLSYANPMVPMIDLFRAPFLYGRGWDLIEVLTVVAWIAGLWLVALASSARIGRRLIFAL